MGLKDFAKGVVAALFGASWNYAPAGERPRPEGLDFAQTRRGAPVPYVYGTVRVDNPIMVWCLPGTPLDVGSGRFSYAASMLLCLGVPSWDEAAAPYNNWRVTNPPRVGRVWYGDKEFAAGPTGFDLVDRETSNALIDLEGDDVFESLVEFLDGSSTQTLSGTLVGAAMEASGINSNTIPAYRNQLLFYVGASRLGTSPRVAKISVEVASLGPQPIGNDANPAWILYDLMCGKVWKLGIDPTKIDLVSFQTAAATLVAESNGASLVLYRSQNAKAVVQSLEAHVNGKLVEDSSTGLISLQLRRANYDPNLIPVMTESNTVGRPELTYVGGDELKNQAVVHFINRSRNYKDDTAIDHRLGNAIGQSNRIRSVDVDYLTCYEPALAAKFASRDLNFVSRPLIAGTAILNRELYDTNREAVLKANWPKWNCINKVFRVLEVNDGQLARGNIKVALIEDVFSATSGAGLAPPAPDNSLLNLVPLTQRAFDEAPFLLCQRSFLDGITPALEQRVFGGAMAEDLGFVANRFHIDTTRAVPAGVAGPLVADVGLHGINAVAFIDTAYSRVAEPYDDDGPIITLTGLGAQARSFFAAMLADLNSGLSPAEVPDFIRFNNANLVLVRPAGSTSGGELMAFEDLTWLGGDRYQFSKTWRGLMDTVAVDHAAGAVVIWIRVADLGTRAWLRDYLATATSYPSRLGLDGTGDDANDAITIGMRIERVPPPQDLCVAGYEVAGTAGEPPTTVISPLLGTFKAISDLDGALDLRARGHRLDMGQIVRGDEADVFDADTTISLTAQKSGETELELDDFLDLPASGATWAAQAILLGKAGHGSIDVIATSYNSGTGDQCWQAPRVTVNAPQYRDLLCNGSFDYGALSPGWTVTAGAVSVINPGSSSISHETNRHCVAATGIPDSTISQIVDVTGYKPVGLNACLTFYVQQSGVGSVTAVLAALDAGNAVLDTRTSPLCTGASAGWTRYDLEWSGIPSYLPSGTAKIQVDIQINDDVDHTGNTCRVSRCRLIVGQFGGELLGNTTFDNNVAGWTNVVNSFAWDGTSLDGILFGPTGDPQGCARGGAFVLSEIKQENPIDVGLEHGVAVLTFARAHLSAISAAADTGEVILEALDGGGAVVASVTTGAEDLHLTPNIWKFRRLALTLPDVPAVTLRVRLRTTTPSGAACGAAFDDLFMRIHKHLDPTSEVELDFRTPVRARTPNDWQTFHLAYPALAIPVVFGGTSSIANVQPSKVKSLSRQGYSDATPDASHQGILRGFFKTKQEVASDDLDCYVFNGGASPFIRSGGLLDDNYGKFTDADSFTVGVLLRSTPFSWTTAGQLVGRKNPIGWEVGVDALGRAKATFQGASSTLSINSSDVVCDRAPHWVYLRCDGSTMKLYTKAGTASTALAGLGSTVIAFQDLCIGLGFEGQIARVYVWDSALADADIQAMIAEVGADPSGKITTWTNDRAVWVQGAPNADGATLIRFGTADIPIAYEGTAYGLAMARTNTNRIITNDVTDISHWAPESGTFAITNGITDATGLPRGVRVGQFTANAGFRITDMVAPLSLQTWTTVIYMRWQTDVGGTVNVHLLNASEVSMGAVACVLTGDWKRFVITHAWDGTTPTAHLRFVVAGGATGTYEICHALWSGKIGGAFENGEVPIAIQDAGVTISDTRAVRDAALPIAFNYEGEIYAEVQMSAAAPNYSFATIVHVDNGSDNANTRGMYATSVFPAMGFLVDIRDAGGIASGSQPSLLVDITQPQVVRTRWNTFAIPDGGNQVGLVVDGEGSSYGPNAFSLSATPNSKIRIGGRVGIDAGMSGVVRRVIVRSRESKLDVV